MSSLVEAIAFLAVAVPAILCISWLVAKNDPMPPRLLQIRWEVQEMRRRREEEEKKNDRTG